MKLYFANSHLYYLLLIIPLMLLLYALFERKKKKDLLLMANKSVLLKLTRSISPFKYFLKRFLLVFACLFIILTILRPQWGQKLVKLERKGIDLVFVVDVSKSMLAEDIKPNRLKKAGMQISSFLDRLAGDRVGLVVFAGSSFISCPLTLDYNALKQFISWLSVDMVSKQGTLIGNAMKTARSAFKSDEKNHKAIVLLTDGEDHASDPLEEAKRCRQEGIRIYTIGIGKRSGEPIPIKNEAGEMIGFKKDQNGKVVVSRLDELTLQKIAVTTGGKYYFSQYGELELERIYTHINQIEKKKLGSLKMKQLQDRYFIFSLLAFLFLFSEYFISVKRRKLLSFEKDNRYE